MKLIMTLLVRDEADILAANLDFHLAQGVDYVIATDNLSTDGTSDILKSYQRQGVLYYIYESKSTYDQNNWITRMAKMAYAKFGADWVINNDADEFWWPEDRDLKKLLSLLSLDTIAVKARRINFLPPSVLSKGYFFDSMTIREAHSLNPLGKPLPPKVCHRAIPDIVVAKGNHSVSQGGNKILGKTIPITIFHFPMRSYTQFFKKVSNFYEVYRQQFRLSYIVNRKYQKWSELLQSGALEAYYLAHVLDEKETEKGIQEGRLVKDVRLKNFLNKLSVRTRS